jgi:peroxiredoxin
MRKLFLFIASLTLGFGAPPPGVGEMAPGFTLSNLDGAPRTLAEARGTGPLVLVILRGFPGYQCPLCNRQVMEFVKSGPDFMKAGARVMLVYPGPKANAQDKAQEFVTGKNLPRNFELVVDPDYMVTNLYRLRWEAPNETAYPSTFVVDREGRIRWAKVSRTHGGRATAAEVLEALRALGG